MLKRLLLLSFIIAFTCNFVYADGRLIPKAQYDKIVKMQLKNVIPNENYVVVQNSVVKYISPVTTTVTYPFTINFSESDFITSATFTPTTGQSIYDLQSNGSNVQLWQNPNNPDQIHAVYMTADYGDVTFTNRRSKYFYSSDRGVTWTFVGEVPNAVRSGYVTVTGMSDGNILVANHSAAGGDPVRTQIFADVFPGLGSFLRLDPGIEPTSEVIWPRLIATSSITNTNKFVLLSSNQVDSAFTNVGTLLTEPGAFTGWTKFNSNSAETHAIARGTDGRIGIAYLQNDVQVPADAGDIFFMESTDDGATFSTPLKIFDADFSPTGDSLGGLRGVSLVYQYNIPKVSYEIMWSDPGPGSYRPLWPSKIMFWSTTLPGSDPNRSIVVADTNNVWYPKDSLDATQVNDVFGPVCRPVIGHSSDNNALFMAFLSITNRIGGSSDSTNFHAIYFTASGDGGETWKTPIQLTPNVMDWTYASMSPISDMDASNYYVNMLIQKDTIPGSFVQGGGNGQSLAQQMFTRIAISKDSITIGINNISNEIPDAYNLFQNYPNPFNPNTKIRFELPNASNVTLKVYNVRGQLVEVLVNNEKVTAGLKEVEFNATNLSSGIYFYTIQVGDFKATKKMMLIK